jgi:ABC-type Zn uptake system ZnuABC Zn-binding protein ZnuA
LAVETFLAEIAQNVTGERAKVESLIPIGIDPHTFQLAPQDVAKITESNLLILNGAGFEEWAAETLENAGGERMVIEASAGLTSREAREGEEAVMSPEEKAEAICVDLADKTADEEIVSGNDAAGAVELHGEEEHEEEASEHEHEAELLSLKLNPSDSGYAGYVKFDVAEDGEYVIAANGGTLAVAGADGAEMEVEETLPVQCAGLDGGILLDLEPGEYVIALSGLAEEMTPFFAGSAGGHHHHHEGDPHFWLDPNNVVKYVENIRDGLIAADPDGKDIYTQNAASYIAQLNELDAWIKQQVNAIPEERRLIVTNHESFGYFADRYGFKIIGTIIPSVSTDSSPSAQQMARLVDHIRETGAIAIFLETGSNPQLAEQIAAETGIKVVSELYTHSITDASGKAPTYIDMMKYNVQAIVEALK